MVEDCCMTLIYGSMGRGDTGMTARRTTCRTNKSFTHCMSVVPTNKSSKTYVPSLGRHGLFAGLLFLQLLVFGRLGILLNAVNLQSSHHLGEDVGLDGQEDDVALQNDVRVVVRGGRAQLAPVDQIAVRGRGGQDLRRRRNKKGKYKLRCNIFVMSKK